MKKITLSAMAMLALSGAAASANTLTLYTDQATGQVYTTPGEGRVEMGDFVDAKTVYMENQAQDSAIMKKETKAEKKYSKVKSKAGVLKFSGKHYLGYRYTDMADAQRTGDIGTDNSSKFETRRNYFQVKAYFKENPKSYMRITMDTYQNSGIEIDETGDQVEKQGANDAGRWEVQLKYAFLYIDEILPYTGVEFGQVHRPWIDYEEHNGWWYRSISKVALEASESADLSNSADLGFNLKTKTPYFQSELGIFNGEGYHQQESGQGNSFEWRATAVLTGNGDKKMKPKKDTYAHLSFYGQHQESSQKVGVRDTDIDDGYDYRIYGLHGVYNQPEFLIAAQYIKSESDNDGSVSSSNLNYKQVEGYSINGTYRFGGDQEYGIIARYDRMDDYKGKYGHEAAKEKEYWIAGAYYDWNKNVRFIANVMNVDDNINNGDQNEKDHTDYMFTAEVNW
jgi:hypothetical protein